MWYVASRPTICASWSKKPWHEHFHCDVLVRGLGLGGLRKQKALCGNQPPHKAQTCLMRTWNAPLGLCQREGKNNKSGICGGRGRPCSPLIVICYLRCDTRDACRALLSLCGRSPEKRDTRVSPVFEGLGGWEKGTLGNEDVWLFSF